MTQAPKQLCLPPRVHHPLLDLQDIFTSPFKPGLVASESGNWHPKT